MEKVKFVRATVSCVAIATLLLLIDYFDLPTVVGISVSSINWDLVALVVSNLMVLLLFLVAYYSIDLRKIKMANNKKAVGIRMILESCLDAEKTVEFLTSREILERYVIPKIDFNRSPAHDGVFSKLLNQFSYFDTQLSPLFLDGTLDSEDLDHYFELKTAYRDFVKLRIIFFDVEDSKDIQSAERRFRNSVASIREKYG